MLITRLCTPHHHFRTKNLHLLYSKARNCHLCHFRVASMQNWVASDKLPLVTWIINLFHSSWGAPKWTALDYLDCKNTDIGHPTKGQVYFTFIKKIALAGSLNLRACYMIELSSKQIDKPKHLQFHQTISVDMSTVRKKFVSFRSAVAWNAYWMVRGS